MKFTEIHKGLLIGGLIGLMAGNVWGSATIWQKVDKQIREATQYCHHEKFHNPHLSMQDPLYSDKLIESYVDMEKESAETSMAHWIECSWIGDYIGG